MNDRTPTGDLNDVVDSDPLTAPAGAAVPTATITPHAAVPGLAPLITESVVRSTLSDAENALTREHHLGSDRQDPEHDRVNAEDLTAAEIAELPPGRERS